MFGQYAWLFFVLMAFAMLAGFLHERYKGYKAYQKNLINLVQEREVLTALKNFEGGIKQQLANSRFLADELIQYSALSALKQPHPECRNAVNSSMKLLLSQRSFLEKLVEISDQQDAAVLEKISSNR